jgi:hypothetical protein
MTLRSKPDYAAADAEWPLDRDAPSTLQLDLLERLKVENLDAADIGLLLADAKRKTRQVAMLRRSLEHCRDWYAVRIERITELAKAHDIWPEAACILANGTAAADEPPTYAQLLNQERHKVSALRADNAMLREGAEEWRLAKAEPAHQEFR